MITDQWIEGRVSVLNYIYAHRLFSVSLVLAASSLISQDGRHAESIFHHNSRNPHMNTDIGGIRTVMGVLRAMSGSGNLPAAEYLKNLESLLFDLDNYHAKNSLDRQIDHAANPEVGGIGIATPSTIETTLCAITTAIEKLDSSNPIIPSTSGTSASSTYLTAATTTITFPRPAPAEPTLQQPVSQNFLFSHDVDQGAPLYPQQRTTIDNCETLEDALFNWDTLGPLWAE